MRPSSCLATLLAATIALFISPATGGSDYRSLQIIQPESEATVHDNEGHLDVSVSLTPPLEVATGDYLQLILDGSVAARSSTANFSLMDVPRGEHTLEVIVRNANDDILLRSAPVVVYLWRASLQFPNRMGR